VSYFLFSPPGFLLEMSKTHIALTTHPWFFHEKVFHVSYPRDNTNNMLSYFLLIFPLGFYRSFSDISLYIAPHIFSEMVFGEVIYMSYLQYFSPRGFLMGYQWHSDLFKSQSYMLFSPYFPIRFKGVFIAYLYIHIPQFFPQGFSRNPIIQLHWSQRRFDQGECYEMTLVPQEASFYRWSHPSVQAVRIRD
jgi:hypothetical protein